MRLYTEAWVYKLLTSPREPSAASGCATADSATSLNVVVCLCFLCAACEAEAYALELPAFAGANAELTAQSCGLPTRLRWPLSETCRP